MTYQTINTLAYGMVALILVESALRHRPLTVTKLAVGFHLLLVSLRSGLLEWWPESAMWDWTIIHRVTITASMLAGLLETARYRRIS